jgi:hypothetical protein
MSRSTVSPREHVPARWRRPGAPALPGAATLLFLVLFAGTALAPGDAAADPPGRRAKETAQDRAELRRDRAQLANDRADIRRLSNLIRHLDAARARGDRLAGNRYRARIHAFLRREVRETRRETVQDRREAARSARDLRDDRRDASGDVRERAGDRRDLADDVRDSKESRDRLARERAILAELRSMNSPARRGHPRIEARERALFDEFLQLTKRDARESAKELREDRRGLRQDRQERRESRQDSRGGN